MIIHFQGIIIIIMMIIMNSYVNVMAIEKV